MDRHLPEPTTTRRLSIGTSEANVYSNRFRAQRMADFLVLADAVLARSDVCRILDIGGEAAYWLGLEDVWRGRNLQITMVNLGERPPVGGRFTYLEGDARQLDFPDRAFDIVHSNSVIEHVGGWADMKRMAAEVRRLAPAYFVQTPNYWFPLEPHLRTPFIHWLPLPWQRRIVMARACGFHPRAADVDQAGTILADASLLDAPAMRALFPDAQLQRERVGPFTKSLIAIRAA